MNNMNRRLVAFFFIFYLFVFYGAVALASEQHYFPDLPNGKIHIVYSVTETAGPYPPEYIENMLSRLPAESNTAKQLNDLINGNTKITHYTTEYWGLNNSFRWLVKNNYRVIIFDGSTVLYVNQSALREYSNNINNKFRAGVVRITDGSLHIEPDVPYLGIYQPYTTFSAEPLTHNNTINPDGNLEEIFTYHNSAKNSRVFTVKQINAIYSKDKKLIKLIIHDSASPFNPHLIYVYSNYRSLPNGFTYPNNIKCSELVTYVKDNNKVPTAFVYMTYEYKVVKIDDVVTNEMVNTDIKLKKDSIIADERKQYLRNNQRLEYHYTNPSLTINQASKKAFSLQGKKDIKLSMIVILIRVLGFSVLLGIIFLIIKRIQLNRR